MENSEQALHLCSPTETPRSSCRLSVHPLHCKHTLLISALPRNRVHCSSETELQTRGRHWLALPGLAIRWLFLPFSRFQIISELTCHHIRKLWSSQKLKGAIPNPPTHLQTGLLTVYIGD